MSVYEGIQRDHMEIKGKKYWDFKEYQAYKLENQEKASPNN